MPRGSMPRGVTAGPRILVTAALLVVFAGLASCGGTSATPTPSQPPTNVTSTPDPSALADGPTPVATESNPPGDIPDSQVYVPFSAPGGHVSVKVPEGWAQSSAGAATVFNDKLNRIEIAVSKAGSSPTTASVTSTDVPKLQGSVSNFAAGKVSEVQRAGGTAILVTYEADSPVDPVTGRVVRDACERYTFYQAGQRLDLTLTGPKNADNVDPWQTVSDSVKWR